MSEGLAGSFSCEIVGHTMEDCDRIDIAYPDIVGNLDDDGGVGEDGTDAGINKHVCDLLGTVGGNCNNGNPDAERTDGGGDLVIAADSEAGEFLPNFLGIVIENGNNPDSVAAETFVAGDGLAEVAKANKGGGPILGETEDTFDVAEELLDIVTNALLAKLAKIGEILTDLGGGDIDTLT